MREKASRKELAAGYKATRPEAGVYRIVNTRTGRSLIGSTQNLAGMQNRFAFARATNSASALDLRLVADIREFGLAAFTIEVLESVEVKAETAAGLEEELATLLELWRERFASDRHY